MEAEVPMDWRIKRFLESLLDGEWHLKSPKGVGVGTVEACIHLGLVKTKRVDRKRKGIHEPYRIAFRITRRGRTALKNEYLAMNAFRAIAKIFSSL